MVGEPESAAKARASYIRSHYAKFEMRIPMRDGKRMAADLYRPKDASKKYPTVFSRTPYNFNYWDVRNGVIRDMSSVIDAVKRGYAHITMNERG